MKTGLMKTATALALTIALLAISGPVNGQTARVALETYEEGPVWQIMTFRAPPGRIEARLKNMAMVWEHQLKLAVEKGVLVDYKVLTKWSADPDDWNIMVIEIFPDMAAYDTFWEDWAEIDAETVDLPEYQEKMKEMTGTGTEFLGTVFAREVKLKPR